MRDEELLGSGAWNTVHRVGDRVMRTTCPWTPTIHAVLRRLESVGFPWSPRVFGFHEDGREILSYIPGVPLGRPWPADVLRPDGLRPFVAVIRAYHEAIAGFVPEDGNWWVGDRRMLPGEIICHGDLGLWNFLWDEGRVTGLIDWDGIRPAHALYDVARFAFNAVPLQDDDLARQAGFLDPPDRRARLETIVDAYGLSSSVEVLVEVLRWREEDRIQTLRKGRAGIRPWADFLAREPCPERPHEGEWLAAHFDELIGP